MLRVQDVDNSEMGGDGPREVTIEDEDNEDESDQRSSFNSLVTSDSKDSAKTRRIRWLTQICEYWPLEKLCALTDADIEDILDEYKTPPRYPSDFIPSSLRKGRISLVGSGPGHPSLLTLEAMTAIKSAEVILADKLVSAEVLALIPRRTSVFIAKKFPGNADPAQEELLSLGIAALRAGKYVVRLKQGDPYIYGRGAEEFDAYSASGFPPSVIPGITSALSAPLFAEIPGTHRGVADQVLICTGTGRKGAPPDPPAWVETRTTIFLMALHRVAALINELASKGWPMDVPCAVVERASCSDQRVIRTRLGEVVGAVEALGSRPPGLLVVGRACTVLKGQEMATKWSVEEGFMGFVDRESIF
jgi:uroporphyrin-III C-methyltransferase